MPIQPIFNINPFIAGETAFATGRGNRLAARDRFALQQAQLAEQARQFNISQMMGQQRANQDLAYARYRDQMIAAQRAAEANRAFQQRLMLGDRDFQHRMALGKADDAARMAYAENRADASAALKIPKMMEDIGHAVVGINSDGTRMFDPEQLSPPGQEKYRELQKTYQAFQKDLRSGKLHARDVPIVIGKLQSQAAQLADPIYRKPQPRSAEERANDTSFTRHGVIYNLDKNGVRKKVGVDPVAAAQDIREHPEYYKPVVVNGTMYQPVPGGDMEVKHFSDYIQNATEQTDKAEKNGTAPYMEWNAELGKFVPKAGEGVITREQWIHQQALSAWNQDLNGPVGGANGAPQPPAPQPPYDVTPPLAPPDQSGEQQPEAGGSAPGQTPPPSVQQQPPSLETTDDYIARDEPIPPPGKVKVAPYNTPAPIEIAPEQQPQFASKYSELRKPYESSPARFFMAEQLAQVRQIAGIPDSRVNPPRLKPIANDAELEQMIGMLNEYNHRYNGNSPAPLEAKLMWRSIARRVKEYTTPQVRAQSAESDRIASDNPSDIAVSKMSKRLHKENPSLPSQQLEKYLRSFIDAIRQQSGVTPDPKDYGLPEEIANAALDALNQQ